METTSERAERLVETRRCYQVMVDDGDAIGAEREHYIGRIRSIDSMLREMNR